MQRLDHGAIGNGRVLALVAPDSGDRVAVPAALRLAVGVRRRCSTRSAAARSACSRAARRGARQSLATSPNTNVLAHRVRGGRRALGGASTSRRASAAAPGATTARSSCAASCARSPARRGCAIDFAPRPDYGARRGSRCSSTQYGVEVLDARRAAAPVHEPARRLHRAAAPSSSLREPLYFVLSVRRPRDAADARGRRPPARRDHRRLAAVGEDVRAAELRARARAALGAVPEAARVRRHRRDHRGDDDEHPRGDRHAERTWDYRYCWLRDAAFVVEALRRLSHLNEGEQFLRFLRDVAESRAAPAAVRHRAASATLPESMLDHLRGFGGNGPVRDRQRGGRAAAERPLRRARPVPRDRADRSAHRDRPPAATSSRSSKRLVEQGDRARAAAGHGHLGVPHASRGTTRSRARCAGRRSIAARCSRARSASASWRRSGARSRRRSATIVPRARLQRATRRASRSRSTASTATRRNLLLPTIGLIDARDPRFLVDARRLRASRMTSGGLMLRYTNRDDFGETTSAFTICSFWWAEALALAGRLDEAIEVFERVVAPREPARACSARTSTRTPARCSATSRRRTRTSGSSTRR